MGEERGEAVAVVDDDGAAGEEKVRVGQGDDAAGRRLEVGTAGRGDIDAEMRAARLAVEDALAAVDAADRAERRPVERLEGIGQVGVAGAGGVDADLLGLDTLQLLGVRLDLVLGQVVDALDVVFALSDHEFLNLGLSVGVGDGDSCVGPLIAAEGQHEPAIASDRHALLVECDAAAGVGAAEGEPTLGEVTVERDGGPRAGDKTGACKERQHRQERAAGWHYSRFPCRGSCRFEARGRGLSARPPAVAATSPSANWMLSPTPGVTAVALVTGRSAASRTSAKPRARTFW